MAKAEVNETINLDELLGQLPIELREGALEDAARAPAGIVRQKARQLVPRGDPSHNPEAKALIDTLIIVIRKYNNGQRVLALVGPGRPAGAHGHLVEEGHEVVVSRGERKGQKALSGTSYVPGKEFLAPAGDTTIPQQNAAVERVVVRAIKEAGG